MRKFLAALYIIIALILGSLFYMALDRPASPFAYFQKEYYNQLGPLTICVEMLIAGIHLFIKHKKANFTLALFGFTALLDPVFNWVGLFDTNVPLYGSMIFIFCAIPALWLAFTNTFGLGKISISSTLLSFGLGLSVELFFNYW